MEAGGTPPGGAAPPPEGGAAPSEEELRARLEEEMRKVRVQDLLLQSVASLVNLTARRIVKEDERDLEQARIGIEAVRALAELLEPEPPGRAEKREVLYASTEAPVWPELSRRLSEIVPPRTSADAPRRVPSRLRHVFWNVAPSQLDVAEDGPFIARHLIQADNLDGLAWGARYLRAEDWDHAARTRGLDPALRRMALNIAAARRRESGLA